jgi:hypothetical protein
VGSYANSPPFFRTTPDESKFSPDESPIAVTPSGLARAVDGAPNHAIRST